MNWSLWAPVMLGGVLAGSTTGVLGVYIVGMRIPFLGVCVSHAALAGGVFGALFGLTGPALLVPAMAAAMITALLLGLLGGGRLRMDANVAMGFFFSLTMGLAFLGIGLFSRFGRSDNEALGLLWGSLTFCSWRDVLGMGAIAAVTAAFVVVLGKEMRAILFSREQATAAGIHVTAVWTGFLVLTSVVLTVNFQTVGGLMIYSLMTNPAAAAFLLVRGHGRALVVSALLGAISGLGGFLLALWLDLPTGATIVIFSSLLVAGAAIGAHRFRICNESGFPAKKRP